MKNNAAGGYRPDVDGLRAVAVLAVLFYHAFPTVVGGGFVGVDVFFVISGFLISGIILDGLERGDFSFANFYARRVRRIFPGLILVCVVCVAFGWFALLPAEFRRLGEHTLAGAGFCSNIALLLEAGYFDTAAAHKPLLHLWSLGVEEQYYLVWPLLLVLVRGRPRATLLLMLAAGLASFALNIYVTARNADYAFYLPLTRFWELMVGSTLAHWQRSGSALLPHASGNRQEGRRAAAFSANLCAAGGSIAIVAALALISDARRFPGWWALLACVGPLLLIAAGPAAWINSRVLASRPMVLLGLISYPLYLWHWPILAYAGIILQEPSVAFRLGALLLSCLLAWATYRIVELPLRHPQGSAASLHVTRSLAVGMVLVALVGAAMWAAILPPLSARDPRLERISEAMLDREGAANRIYPGDVPDTTLFIGDSHMEQYWPRIERLVQQHARPRRTVDFRFLPSCAPMPGLKRLSVDCLGFVDRSFRRALDPEVRVVVIAASWMGFVLRDDYYSAGDDQQRPLQLLAPENQWIYDDFSQALRVMRQAGKRVVVVLSSPRGYDFDPDRMVMRRHLLPVAVDRPVLMRAALEQFLAPIDDRIRVAAQRAGAEVLSPLDWFCDATVCPAVDARGQPLLMDLTHIRASAARERVTALDALVLLPAAAGRSAGVN